MWAIYFAAADESFSLSMTHFLSFKFNLSTALIVVITSLRWTTINTLLTLITLSNIQPVGVKR